MGESQVAIEQPLEVVALDVGQVLGQPAQDRRGGDDQAGRVPVPALSRRGGRALLVGESFSLGGQRLWCPVTPGGREQLL